MIAKSQYEAAISMHDIEWSNRIEPEYLAAKAAYEKSVK